MMTLTHHEVLLPTVESSGVHSVLPADLGVGHPDLLPIIGDGDPGEHQGHHVEPINVARSKSGAQSEIEDISVGLIGIRGFEKPPVVMISKNPVCCLPLRHAF